MTRNVQSKLHGEEAVFSKRHYSKKEKRRMKRQGSEESSSEERFLATENFQTYGGYPVG